MFTLPNKTGFEVVTHFLFTCLDSAQCREHFRWSCYVSVWIT